MNKKQWYASGIILTIFFFLNATTSVSLGIDIAGRIYSALAWLFLAGSFICFACGSLEKDDMK